MWQKDAEHEHITWNMLGSLTTACCIDIVATGSIFAFKSSVEEL